MSKSSTDVRYSIVSTPRFDHRDYMLIERRTCILQDEALQQQLESVRSKFRAVVAIMGIQEDIFPSSTVNSALSF